MTRRWRIAALALLLASAATPASARDRRAVHTVERGDTTFTIAWRYGVAWADIAAANRIAPDAPLRPRQRLVIPAPEGPRRVSPAPRPSSSAQPPAPRFAWPLEGPVRRGFAPRGGERGHDGLDITVREGTTVRASAAGTVAFAGEEPRQFGKLVVIDHGNGWHSAYGFLDRISVREGERVRQGQRIGASGRTGMARGGELHFELRRGRQPVDPLPRLPERD